MRFFIVFLAIFGATIASTVALTDLEEAAKAMIICGGKALDGGLPEAQLPDHNPLIGTKNVTLPVDILGVTGYAKLNHFEMHELVTFDVTTIEGTLTDNNTVIDYNYAIWWDKWVIVANYTVDLNGPLGLAFRTDGDITVSFNGVQAAGIWNMVLEPKHLNDYLVKVTATTTDVTVTGLDLLDGVFNTLGGPLLNLLLNTLDPAPFSGLLLDVFNNEWLNEAGLHRIDAVLENCKKN